MCDLSTSHPSHNIYYFIVEEKFTFSEAVHIVAVWVLMRDTTILFSFSTSATQDDVLNLSILLSTGKENNRDFPSNGE